MNKKIASELLKIAKELVAYPGDPYWITVKYPSKCHKCNKPIAKGEEAFYYPKYKQLYGDKCGCGKTAENDFNDKVEEEEFYNR